MEQIKQLLRAGDLKQANKLLTQLIRSPAIIDPVWSTIKDDLAFWLNIFDHHEFRIVPDGTDMEQIVEPRYVNVVTVSFFLSKIDTVTDVLRYSIHGGAHYKCEQLWQKCPVPMDTFNENYLAWIEDIYGQRFVHVTAPFWHFDMYITAMYYFEFHNIEMTQAHRDVVALLTRNPQVDHPVFNAVHHWLYTADPLDQNTFNQYIMFWQRAMTNPDVKAYLDSAFVI